MLIQPVQPPSRPQVHTQKHHDEYNGIRHLPQTTHVRVTRRRRSSSEDNNNNTDTNDDDYVDPTTEDSSHTQDHTYTYTCTITLHYTRNRACEIYRSLDDLLALSKNLTISQNLLVAMGSTGRQQSDGNGRSKKEEEEEEEDNEGRRDSKTRHASYCACTCSCCACPPGRRCQEAQIAEEADRVLKATLEKVRKGDADLAVKVALEWFLRRRLGDCDGKGGG